MTLCGANKADRKNDTVEMALAAREVDEKTVKEAAHEAVFFSKYGSARKAQQEAAKRLFTRLRQNTELTGLRESQD